MRGLLQKVCGLVLALGANGAMATQMMCGEVIIDDEQLVPPTADQIIAACGEPTSRLVGQWVYKQEGQFTKILTFDANGDLQTITEEPDEE